MQKIAIVASLAVLICISQPSQAQPARTFEGRKLFNSNCYLCHGTDGKGGGPLASKLNEKPADLTSPEVSGKSDAELSRVIQGTSPHGKSLPKWTKAALADPDVQAILSYMRFIQKSKHALIGDPDAGRDIYTRYCVVCHGDGGRGNGPMTSILDIHPADHTRTKQMDRITNGQLVTYIARGGPVGKTYMPAWEGVLSAEEIQAVASYIRLLSFKPE